MMKTHIFTFNDANALQPSKVPSYWVNPMNPINLLVGLWIGDYHVGVLDHHIRVAKRHKYDEYVRVNIFERLGKNCG